MFTITTVCLAISLIAAMVALSVSIFQRKSEYYQAVMAANFLADGESEELRRFVMFVGEVREALEPLEKGAAH